MAVPAAAAPDAASEVSATVYGLILASGSMNTTGVNNVDVPLFATADPQGGSLGFSARQSRVGVKFSVPTAAWLGGAAGKALVELDFFGGFPNGNLGRAFPVPRLRLAYAAISWKPLGLTVLAGQDWSVLAPLNPPSITHAAIPLFAASGNLWHRAPQLRLSGEHGGDAALVWAAALMAPVDGEPSDATAFQFLHTPGAGDRSRRPALEARAGGVWRPGAKPLVAAGLSGRLGWERYFLSGGARKDLQGWAAAADLEVTHAMVQIRGEAFVGANLELAMGGVQQGVRKTMAGTSLSAVRGVHARGFWLQLSATPLDWLAAHAGLGVDVPSPADLTPTMRARNLSLTAALVARAGRWKAGLEASRYQTRTGGATARAWQIGLATIVEL